MWILPNNNPLSSVFAQEYADSKEDLKEYFDASVSPLMWKSKPLSWKTFLPQWKKVWWLRHLSGRILKPSTGIHFETALMESLEVIPVSHSVLPATETGPMIQDTFTRILNQELAQLDLFGASSKTLQGTSQWDTTKYQKAFERWVTELRAESTLRKKLAQHMRESAFSSLPSWPTPTATVCEEDLEKFYVRQKRMKLRHAGRTGNGIGMNIGHAVQNWGTPRVSTNGMNGTNPENPKSRIEDQVLNWPTPVTSDATGGTNYNLPKSNGRFVNQRKSGQIFGAKLRDVVVNWPTPAAKDYKGMNSIEKVGADTEERNHSGQLPNAVLKIILLDKDFTSGNGKNRARLNPAWSIQLMGTTLQKIFTVPLAIQLLSKQQN